MIYITMIIRLLQLIQLLLYITLIMVLKSLVFRCLSSQVLQILFYQSRKLYLSVKFPYLKKKRINRIKCLKNHKRYLIFNMYDLS